MLDINAQVQSIRFATSQPAPLMLDTWKDWAHTRSWFLREALRSPGVPFKFLSSKGYTRGSGMRAQAVGGLSYQ